MVLCVTFNPAVDRTMVVQDFANGGVFRPQQTIVVPGGKGVNVARAVRVLGCDPICAGFLAGFSGLYLEKALDIEGIPARWTWLAGGETRTCVILVDPAHGFTTVVNEPGPEVSAADWMRLHDDVLRAASDTGVVSLSGSLPPGSPLERFTRLVSDLAAAGKEVWVDTSGAPLTAVARVPDVAIKVNDEEAAVLVGQPVRGIAEAASAARRIYATTGRCVVITMGAQGAVLADGQNVWHAVPPAVTIRSGVGSGDSFLAGLLAARARGEVAASALVQATAAGTANALSVGGGSFTRTEFDSILSQTRVAAL